MKIYLPPSIFTRFIAMMILIKLVLAAVGSFEYVPQWTGREKFRLEQNDQYYIGISRTLLELVNC